MAARERVVCLCLSVRILHLAEGFRLPLVSGNVGCRGMGFLQLLLHYHCCRSYLEGHGTGLSATHDSGYRTCVPGQVPVGFGANGTVLCLGGAGQPRTDDLLLFVCYPRNGHRLCH